MKNKILLAIADGVGDRPCEILDWNTPLQYAHTSNLDQLASNGSCGIMDLYHAGIPVGTDLGHLILFGYGLEDYPGRRSHRSIWGRHRTDRRRHRVPLQFCHRRPPGTDF